MADEKDLLLSLYNEHMTQARWHEDQREKVSTLVLLGSGGLLALTTQAEPWQQRVTYMIVLILGLLGIAIALKHYERNRKHVSIGRQLRGRLGQLLPDAAIGETIGSISTHESAACRLVEPVRLYVLWLLLTALMACLGLAMLTISLLQG
ncbi:MAG TPA: hypothetical protein VFG43_16550 [Geminicoccaceae bacterium]|nr:hypothetical protein [Geminicoccaceae bacterium]